MLGAKEPSTSLTRPSSINSRENFFEIVFLFLSSQIGYFFLFSFHSLAIDTVYKISTSPFLFKNEMIFSINLSYLKS